MGCLVGLYLDPLKGERMAAGPAPCGKLHGGVFCSLSVGFWHGFARQCTICCPGPVAGVSPGRGKLLFGPLRRLF